MGENEDYLDSLLKAANVQDDNPDSANNMLREMGFTESAHKDDSAFSDADLLEEETEQIVDLVEDASVEDLETIEVFEEIPETAEVVEESLETADVVVESLEETDEVEDLLKSAVENASESVEIVKEDVKEDVEDVLNSLFDVVENENSSSTTSSGQSTEDFLNSLFEEVSTPKVQENTQKTDIELPKSPAPEVVTSEATIVEEPSVEEIIIEEPMAEVPVTEEIIVEEPTVEEIIVEEPIVEETGAEEIIIEEPAVDEELMPVPNTEDDKKDELSDIDSLLKSDFSGEVDIADIDKLLSSAEEFAAEAEKENEETEEAESAPVSDLGLDSVKNLTQEQIEKMLSGAEDIGDGELEIDMNDMSAIESELGIFDKNSKGTGDDAGLDEISDLINAFDSNETDSSEDADILSILNAEMENNSEENESEKDSSDELGKEKKEKKSKKDKKGKKDKSSKKEKEEKPKKETKLSKFLDFLTASDDEEEEGKELLTPSDAPEAAEGEFEAVPGENQKILAEMDAEGEEDPKGKKKKKKKGKKGKDAPKNPSGDEEGEDGEGLPAKKGKKPKKEKKEKKPLELDIDTGKPLSKKNVRKIFIMCLSLLALIILFAKFVPSMITNASARKAYYSGDYEEAYTSFFGEKLSDSDQILFERSAIIMKLVHKYQFFGYYKEIGMNTEALDQLLQAVENYEPWLMVAELTGATDEFKKEYGKIVSALDAYFGITEERAKAIIALESDLEYSLMVESVANGTEYIDPNTPLQEPFIPPMDEEEPVYEDMLDEEGY